MDGLQPSSAWVYGRFPSRRSVVYGTKGVVACSQPLAAEVGMEILRKGGNAGTAGFGRLLHPYVNDHSGCCHRRFGGS
jgi:gamma-glutamyltranspeptidase/glutathione hydrolase